MDDRRGWIPTYRKIFEPEHWLAPTKRNPASALHAWLDLVQLATHQTRETRNSGTLERGELIASVRTLAKRWCWSKGRTERFLSDLETRTAIGTVRGTADGTVYVIVNYDTYAPAGNAQWDTKRDSEWDSRGTGVGQEQEQKNKRKRKTVSYQPEFLELWTVHPVGSKEDAQTAYKTAVKSGVDHKTILDGLRSYAGYCDSQEDFRGAHLNRWIAKKRWEEEEARVASKARTNGKGKVYDLHGAEAIGNVVR